MSRRLIANVFYSSLDHAKGYVCVYHVLWLYVSGLVPGKAKRVARNVLTRMNDAKGPLAFLQKCMNDRVRVKVCSLNIHISAF